MFPMEKTWGAQEAGHKGREPEGGNIPPPPPRLIFLIEKANLGSRQEGIIEPGLQTPRGFGGNLCSASWVQGAVCGYAAAPVVSWHCEQPPGPKGCGDGEEAHHHLASLHPPLSSTALLLFPGASQ